MSAASPRQPEYPVDPLFVERWSPRAFTGEAIAESELMRLLEAARWAPSAFNAQPWRFVYARRDTASWQPLFELLLEGNRSWVQRAAALLAVVSKETRSADGGEVPSRTHSFDTGAAWMSVALQAHLAGWAAHGMAGFELERARTVLGVPAGYRIEAMVAIGRQGDKSVLTESQQQRELPSARRPLGESVAEGRFIWS